MAEVPEAVKGLKCSVSVGSLITKDMQEFAVFCVDYRDSKESVSREDIQEFARQRRIELSINGTEFNVRLPKTYWVLYVEDGVQVTKEVPVWWVRYRCSEEATMRFFRNLMERGAWVLWIVGRGEMAALLVRADGFVVENSILEITKSIERLLDGMMPKRET